MKMTKTYLYLTLVASFILGILMFFNYAGYFYYSVLTLMFVGSFYILFKEIRVLWRYFTAYMFTIKTSFFDKKIERPRLLMYLFFGSLNLCVLYSLYPHVLEDPKMLDLNNPKFSDINTNYLMPIYTLIYGGTIFLLIFTWSKKFKKRLIPKVQKKILKRQGKSFQIDWEEDELASIFEGLYDFDFVEGEEMDFNKQTFIKYLKEAKTPKDQIKIEMDNKEIDYFFKLLKKRSVDFNLRDFVQIFRHKSNKLSVNSIQATASKTKIPPRNKRKIDKIFDFKQKG